MTNEHANWGQVDDEDIDEIDDDRDDKEQDDDDRDDDDEGSGGIEGVFSDKVEFPGRGLKEEES